jgi:LacI family transcriptional regulator
MERYPTIVLILDSRYGYRREMIRGVSAYAGSHTRWRLRIDPTPPGRAKTTRSDGVIVSAGSRKNLDRLRPASGRIVHVCEALEGPPVPTVLPDDEAVGRLAAKHFLDQGFRRFAFYSAYPATYSWVAPRRRGFTEALKAAGFDCETFRPPRGAAGRRREGGFESALRKWLSGLAKPIALFAANDLSAHQVAEACLDLGLSVPEEVAILGVDNDVLLCESATPPLSSVDPGFQRVGFEAARLMDRLLAGEAAPEEPIVLEPVGIVTRRSSEAIPIEDRGFVRALVLLRQRACEPVSVDMVVREARISRRRLEQRCREVLGRTPHDEIVRVQMEKAQRLLAESRMKVDQVGRQCGYAYAQNFCATFRKKMGMTPASYRRKFQTTA